MPARRASSALGMCCLLWGWENHYSGSSVVHLIGMLSSHLSAIINQEFYFFASQEIGEFGRTPLEILLAERNKQEGYEYISKHVGSIMISDQNLSVLQHCGFFGLNALREFYCQMKVPNT